MSDIVAVWMPSDDQWQAAFGDVGISGNPVPGNIANIDHCRKWFADTAKQVGDQAHDLARAKNPTEASWQGDAANKFVEGIGDTPAKLEALATRFSHIAAALQAYVPELAAAQKKAVDAYWKVQGNASLGYPGIKRQLNQAQQAAITQQDHTGTPPDATAQQQQEQRIQGLQDQYRAAVAQVNRAASDRDDAANSCAGRIDAAGQDILTDPWKKGQGWLGDINNFFHNLAKNVSNIANWVGTIAGIAALLCALIPPLTVLAPILGAIALVAGILTLAADLYLVFVNHDESKSIFDIGVDIVGILPFGRFAKIFKSIGKVFEASEKVTMFAEHVAGATRQAELLKGVGTFPKYVLRTATEDLARATEAFNLAKGNVGETIVKQFGDTLESLKPSKILEDTGKAWTGVTDIVTAGKNGFADMASKYGSTVATTFLGDAANDAWWKGAAQFGAGFTWNAVSGPADNALYGNPVGSPGNPTAFPGWQWQ
jgi:uncharacterized protein YukE